MLTGHGMVSNDSVATITAILDFRSTWKRKHYM